MQELDGELDSYPLRCRSCGGASSLLCRWPFLPSCPTNTGIWASVKGWLRPSLKARLKMNEEDLPFLMDRGVHWVSGEGGCSNEACRFVSKVCGELQVLSGRSVLPWRL